MIDFYTHFSNWYHNPDCFFELGSIKIGLQEFKAFDTINQYKRKPKLISKICVIFSGMEFPKILLLFIICINDWMSTFYWNWSSLLLYLSALNHLRHHEFHLQIENHALKCKINFTLDKNRRKNNVYIDQTTINDTYVVCSGTLTFNLLSDMHIKSTKHRIQFRLSIKIIKDIYQNFGLSSSML